MTTPLSYPQVIELFILIGAFGSDFTQLLKAWAEANNIRIRDWMAVFLSWFSPVLVAFILHFMGLLPGIAFISPLFWGIGAGLLSNGVYKVRKAIANKPING